MKIARYVATDEHCIRCLRRRVQRRPSGLNRRYALLKEMSPRPLCLLILAAVWTPAAGQTVSTEQLSVDVATDGRMAIDLNGGVWLLPEGGGAAHRVLGSEVSAYGPRFSPSDDRLVFQAGSRNGGQIWVINTDGSGLRQIPGSSRNADPTWHPGGERITFASGSGESGFDLWETDLATGLRWRLTRDPGDEREPAWSANGRDLVYVRRTNAHYELMLKRFGQRAVAIYQSTDLLTGPSWRPDGTLITFFEAADNGTEPASLRMAILADPPLVRTLATGEEFDRNAVSWRDRQTLVYTAAGRIRTRQFGAWTARTLPFRAQSLPVAAPRQPITTQARELPLISPATGTMVIRATRLFDGLGRAYLEARDVLVTDGLIDAVAARRNWGDIPVLDLGPDTTLLPGLIDSFAALPDAASGARLLSWGVTTVVAQHDHPARALGWDGDATPGPRLLSRAPLWHPDSPSGFLLTASLPADTPAPERIRWQDQVRELREAGRPTLATDATTAKILATDIVLATGMPLTGSPAAPATQPWVVSALAGSGTPGLSSLFALRQARSLSQPRTYRRVDQPGRLRSAASRIVAGSAPNQLAPGLALHAELRALRAAGLEGHDVLKAAGPRAAELLGLSGIIGEISAGARADLVLVNGDPLQRIADLANVVAVIRNGRFYSAISLLEQVDAIVE